MSKISSNLLSNTLNLVALAREAALAGGKPVQAQDMAPAEQGLRAVAESARRPAQSAPALDPGLQALLALRPSSGASASSVAVSAAGSVMGSANADRLGAAQAMAAGGMSELDIARHLGASREEVQLWLNVGKKR